MLAIVIPYYKLAFFEETLQSLENQTDKRFKVYIGDDASPENPRALLEKYKALFSFVYHRFENNLGGTSLSKQWERCISLIEDEEWIMILGDDDVLGTEVVEKWYENLSIFNFKVELVRFASELISETSNAISETYTHPVWEDATASFLRKYKGVTRSSLSEYIFSKATFKKYGFYDFPLAWNSDDRAWLDFPDLKPVYTINDAIVFIRLSEVNISGRKDNLEYKHLSSIIFYKYLISKKISFYQKKDRHNFLRMYEQETGRFRKTRFTEWLFLAFYYSRYFDSYNFLKFIKRWIKSMLK